MDLIKSGNDRFYPYGGSRFSVGGGTDEPPVRGAVVAVKQTNRLATREKWEKTAEKKTHTHKIKSK